MKSYVAPLESPSFRKFGFSDVELIKEFFSSILPTYMNEDITGGKKAPRVVSANMAGQEDKEQAGRAACTLIKVHIVDSSPPAVSLPHLLENGGILP